MAVQSNTGVAVSATVAALVDGISRSCLLTAPPPAALSFGRFPLLVLLLISNLKLPHKLSLSQRSETFLLCTAIQLFTTLYLILSVSKATISFFVWSIVWPWSALNFLSHWKESSSVSIHLKAFSYNLFIVEPRKTWIIHLCLLQRTFTVRVAWYRCPLFDEKTSILVCVYRLVLYLSKLHPSDLEGEVESIFCSLFEETTFSSG